MITNVLYQNLLEMPKIIAENGVSKTGVTIRHNIPFEYRFQLLAEEDNDEWAFLYDVSQSRKNNFKATLYLMENSNKIGLLRIDYSGKHKNPEVITDSVPSKFHPFVGKMFDYHEHHVHYYVDGYKTSLDWAIPLAYDDFPVKDIQSQTDLVNAFFSFNNRIRLTTKVELQSPELL